MKKIYLFPVTSLLNRRFTFGFMVVALFFVFQLCPFGSRSQKSYWLESMNNKVRKIDAANQSVAATGAAGLAAATAPLYIFLDERNGFVYWSDAGSGSIKKVSTAGGAVTTVVTGISGAGIYPRGIYLDITNNMIYWGQTAPGLNDAINKIDISGSLPKTASNGTVVVSAIDIVRGITIDTTANQVYFADAGIGGTGKGIYRAASTSSTSEAASTNVAATGLQPNSLFIDRTGNFIYWSDFAAAGGISRAATNSGFPAAVATVFTGTSIRGMTVDVGNNTIYWTEYPSLKIRKASLVSIPVAGESDVVTGLSDLPRNLQVTPPCSVDIGLITAAANPVCNGKTTMLTASGVTGPNATVAWWTGSNGTGTQVGSGLTSDNVGAGTYFARVTSDCGTDELSFTVTEFAAVTPADTTAVACNSFTWRGITYYRTGDKYDTATNVNGCDSITILHLTINTVPNTFVKTDAGCFGSSTGSITMTPTGGVSPYMYRIGTTGPISAPSGTFGSLKAGSYRVYVQDANGCIGVAGPVVIGQSPKVNATVTPTPVSGCFSDSNGVLTITAPIGTSPFMYKLGNAGSYAPFTPPFSITGLKAGSYIVYLQDADGCTGSTGSKTITQPSKVTTTTTVTQPTCNGFTNGKITVSNTIGISPFTYKLGTGPSVPITPPFDYTSLKAGNYSIYIQDANGCQGAVPVTVGQPAKVAATLAGTNLSCYGSADGKIAIINPIGIAPFQYKLGTAGAYASFTAPYTITGLTAGNYGVYLQDANGCVGAAGVMAITQPIAVAVNFIKTEITCSTPGSLSLSAPNSPGATFKINPGSSIYTAQSTYSIPTAGTYYGYAKDATGCAGRVGPIVYSNCVPPPFARAANPMLETGNETFDVTLSPNPSTNQFTLLTRGGNMQPVSIRVIDVNGKAVYEAKGQQEQSFRFGSNLSNGFYLVEVRQGNVVKTMKAVKGK